MAEVIFWSFITSSIARYAFALIRVWRECGLETSAIINQSVVGCGSYGFNSGCAYISVALAMNWFCYFVADSKMISTKTLN